MALSSVIGPVGTFSDCIALLFRQLLSALVVFVGLCASPCRSDVVGMEFPRAGGGVRACFLLS